MTIENPREIKCSTKQSLSNILRSGRQALLGGGVRDLPATENIVFSGLGAAVPVCISVANRLERDSICRITGIQTGMKEVTSEDGRVRNVCQLKVYACVHPQARKQLP